MAYSNPEDRRAASRRHYLANRKAVIARARDWKKANPEAARQHRATTYENRLLQEQEYSRRWKRENPARHAALNAGRRSALKRRPRWADAAEIAKIYALSRRCRAAGLETHVGHIVPLKNPLVYGLHCEANLAVMDAHENMSLGNRWWPDMPGPVST